MDLQIAVQIDRAQGRRARLVQRRRGLVGLAVLAPVLERAGGAAFDGERNVVSARLRGVDPAAPGHVEDFRLPANAVQRVSAAPALVADGDVGGFVVVDFSPHGRLGDPEARL